MREHDDVRAERDEFQANAGYVAMLEVLRPHLGSLWNTEERELVRRAAAAYLDATAPSRAPDGGVTRDKIAALIRQHVSGVAWIDGRSRKVPATVGSEEAADAILARLAASHAGDRERLEEAARDVVSQQTDFYTARNGRRVSIQGDDGERCVIVPYEAIYRLEHALVPAAGQDDTEKAQP